MAHRSANPSVRDKPVTTLDDVVEHYQSQVPGLRANFARSLTGIREQLTREGRLFTPAYVNALFAAAEDEIRNRHASAAESLHSAVSIAAYSYAKMRFSPL
jgi:hypothetical protein